MNGLQLFESTIEQTTETMPPSHKTIEGFTVADVQVILVVGQTQQNLQWMYGENRDFDAW